MRGRREIARPLFVFYGLTMPFTNVDDLLLGQVSGQRPQLVKGNVTSEGAGLFHSLWMVAGFPAAAATPPAFTAGSGYVPTKATQGSIAFSNPAAGKETRISLMEVMNVLQVGQLIICDRMWHCSGFGTVSTSLQSVTTPGSLPSGRDPNSGADVIPYIEVYSVPGATAATWTMTGTDAAGNTSRTWTYAHPANAETVGQMMPLLPGGASPAAVLGCRQVTSFQCSGSSGTAGDVGITLVRRLAGLSVVSISQPGFKDYNQLGLPRVYDDAALAMMVLCSATSTGRFEVDLQLAQN